MDEDKTHLLEVLPANLKCKEHYHCSTPGQSTEGLLHNVKALHWLITCNRRLRSKDNQSLAQRCTSSNNDALLLYCPSACKTLIGEQHVTFVHGQKLPWPIKRSKLAIENRETFWLIIDKDPKWIKGIMGRIEKECDFVTFFH